MNIYTNGIEEIVFEKNTLNILTFRSAIQQYRFRDTLLQWIKGREREDMYFRVTYDGYDVVSKDFDIVNITGGALEFLEAKDANKQIMMFIKQQFEMDEQLLPIYTHMKNEIERTFHEMTIKFADFEIEFDLQSLVLENLLKQVEITITSNKENVSAFEYRKFIIDMWLQSLDGKRPKLLIYHFPEADLPIADMKQLLAYLNDLKVTVICITSKKVNADIVNLSNIKLFKENGSIYNISGLYNELMLFDYSHSQLSLEQLVKDLAFYDFNDDLLLLSDRWRTFLESNKF
ncbi:hypothetical protein [Solibacillus sp. FSL H8-0538]|uniref:hypothetical protein n=1 Tax=Solibacillus sp. FSL H8-0538 TaxID=2921400 RepID=UPI0030F6660E